VSRSVAALVHRLLRKRAEERPSAQEVAEVLTEMAAAVLPVSARPSTKLQIVASSSGVQPLRGPLPHLSTLGGSVGQRAKSRSMRLRHWLLSLTERVPWLAARTSPRQRLIGVGVGALLLTLAVGFGGIALLRPSPAQESAQAPPRVRWSLSSTPPGAQILRRQDQAVLGQTPWAREQTAASGTLNVVLRLKGYKDRELVLDQSHDVQLSETLDPLPEPAAGGAGEETEDRGSRRSGKSGSHQKDGGSRRGKHVKKTKLID
jgi:hypothetical protein